MRQSAIRQFLLKEMTLRVIKNYIRNSIREFKCSSTTRNSTTDITVLFKQTIASVYNEIFSETSYEANLFWKQKVRCLLFLKYGEQSAPLSDYENRPSMDLRTILLSKDGSDGKFSLLLELPQFTGVSICNKEKLKTYQVNPTDLGDTPFSPDDFSLTSTNMISGLSRTYADILHFVGSKCLGEVDYDEATDGEKNLEEYNCQMICLAFGENSPEHLLSLQIYALNAVNYEDKDPKKVLGSRFWTSIGQAARDMNKSDQKFPVEYAVVALFCAAAAQYEYQKRRRNEGKLSSSDDVDNDALLRLAIVAHEQIENSFYLHPQSAKKGLGKTDMETLHGANTNYTDQGQEFSISHIDSALLSIIANVCKTWHESVQQEKEEKRQKEKEKEKKIGRKKSKTRHIDKEMKSEEEEDGPSYADLDRDKTITVDESLLRRTKYIVELKGEYFGLYVSSHGQKEWGSMGVWHESMFDGHVAFLGHGETMGFSNIGKKLHQAAARFGIPMHSADDGDINIDEAELKKYQNWARKSPSSIYFDYSLVDGVHVTTSDDLFLFDGLTTVNTASMNKEDAMPELRSRLWSFGEDRLKRGVLGHGTYFDLKMPREIKALCGFEIVSIATGKGSSFAVSREGVLFRWGKIARQNDKDGTRDILTPEVVPGDSRFEQIYCYRRHVVCKERDKDLVDLFVEHVKEERETREADTVYAITKNERKVVYLGANGNKQTILPEKDDLYFSKQSHIGKVYRLFMISTLESGVNAMLVLNENKKIWVFEGSPDGQQDATPWTTPKLFKDMMLKSFDSIDICPFTNRCICISRNSEVLVPAYQLDDAQFQKCPDLFKYLRGEQTYLACLNNPIHIKEGNDKGRETHCIKCFVVNRDIVSYETKKITTKSGKDQTTVEKKVEPGSNYWVVTREKELLTFSMKRGAHRNPEKHVQWTRASWEVTDDSYMKQIYESGITKMISKRDSSLILVYGKHLFSIERGSDKLTNFNREDIEPHSMDWFTETIVDVACQTFKCDSSEEENQQNSSKKWFSHYLVIDKKTFSNALKKRSKKADTSEHENENDDADLFILGNGRNTQSSSRRRKSSVIAYKSDNQDYIVHCDIPENILINASLTFEPNVDTKEIISCCAHPYQEKMNELDHQISLVELVRSLGQRGSRQNERKAAHRYIQLQSGTSIFTITENGKAYAQGSNLYGNLGLGSDQDHFTDMTQITSLTGRKVLNICASPEHTLFLTQNSETSKHEVFAVGKGSKCGRLGLYGANKSSTPRMIKSLMRYNIDKVACSMNRSMICGEGRVWKFGQMDFTDMILAKRENTIQLQAKHDKTAAFTHFDVQLNARTDFINQPYQISFPPGTFVVDIALGDDSYFALDSTRRSVWAWGVLHGFTANREEQPAFVDDTAFLGKSTGKVPLGPFGRPFASRNGQIGMIRYEDNCKEHEAYADKEVQDLIHHVEKNVYGSRIRISPTLLKTELAADTNPSQNAIEKMVAGSKHLLCLSKDLNRVGTVWVYGCGGKGQLGIGWKRMYDEKNYSHNGEQMKIWYLKKLTGVSFFPKISLEKSGVPKHILGITDIYANGNQSAAIDYLGNLFTWGAGVQSIFHLSTKDETSSYLYKWGITEPLPLKGVEQEDVFDESLNAIFRPTQCHCVANLKVTGIVTSPTKSILACNSNKLMYAWMFKHTPGLDHIDERLYIYNQSTPTIYWYALTSTKESMKKAKEKFFSSGAGPEPMFPSEIAQIKADLKYRNKLSLENCTYVHGEKFALSATRSGFVHSIPERHGFKIYFCDGTPFTICADGKDICESWRRAIMGHINVKKSVERLVQCFVEKPKLKEDQWQLLVEQLDHIVEQFKSKYFNPKMVSVLANMLPKLKGPEQVSSILKGERVPSRLRMIRMLCLITEENIENNHAFASACTKEIFETLLNTFQFLTYNIDELFELFSAKQEYGILSQCLNLIYYALRSSSTLYTKEQACIMLDLLLPYLKVFPEGFPFFCCLRVVEILMRDTPWEYLSSSTKSRKLFLLLAPVYVRCNEKYLSAYKSCTNAGKVDVEFNVQKTYCNIIFQMFNTLARVPVFALNYAFSDLEELQLQSTCLLGTQRMWMVNSESPILGASTLVSIFQACYKGHWFSSNMTDVVDKLAAHQRSSSTERRRNSWLGGKVVRANSVRNDTRSFLMNGMGISIDEQELASKEMSKQFKKKTLWKSFWENIRPRKRRVQFLFQTNVSEKDRTVQMLDSATNVILETLERYVAKNASEYIPGRVLYQEEERRKQEVDLSSAGPAHISKVLEQSMTQEDAFELATRFCVERDHIPLLSLEDAILNFLQLGYNRTQLHIIKEACWVNPDDAEKSSLCKLFALMCWDPEWIRQTTEGYNRIFQILLQYIQQKHSTVQKFATIAFGNTFAAMEKKEELRCFATHFERMLASRRTGTIDSTRDLAAQYALYTIDKSLSPNIFVHKRSSTASPQQDVSLLKAAAKKIIQAKKEFATEALEGKFTVKMRGMVFQKSNYSVANYSPSIQTAIFESESDIDYFEVQMQTTNRVHIGWILSDSDYPLVQNVGVGEFPKSFGVVGFHVVADEILHLKHSADKAEYEEMAVGCNAPVLNGCKLGKPAKIDRFYRNDIISCLRVVSTFKFYRNGELLASHSPPNPPSGVTFLPAISLGPMEQVKCAFTDSHGLEYKATIVGEKKLLQGKVSFRAHSKSRLSYIKAKISHGKWQKRIEKWHVHHAYISQDTQELVLMGSSKGKLSRSAVPEFKTSLSRDFVVTCKVFSMSTSFQETRGKGFSINTGASVYDIVPNPEEFSTWLSFLTKKLGLQCELSEKENPTPPTPPSTNLSTPPEIPQAPDVTVVDSGNDYGGSEYA